MGKTKERETNAEFAKYDKKFNDFCRVAEVEPTRRQASKFRMSKGKVYRICVKKDPGLV